MNFSHLAISEFWLTLANLIYFPLLFYVVQTAGWHHLKNSADSHVLFASILILWVFWQMSAGITAGMEFHILLVTSVTLMFGWRFAVLIVSVVQLGLTLQGKATWTVFTLNTVCNGLIPILVTYVTYWFAYFLFPRHFFIYIYICAFAGGALSMLFSRLAGISILLLAEIYTLKNLGDEPLFILIMLFPEAFINGVLMTLMVAFKPQWVGSFSDDRYLRGK